ncbi:hypothetical protein BDV12DRAFT_180732 [Aspergillus spectabilis]
MSEVAFIEYHLLAAKERSDAIRTCAAISSPKKGRCEERFSLDCPSDLEDLHGQLDDADRADILQRIAELSVCDVHNEPEDIAAAAGQWQSAIRTRVRPVEPQTPRGKNRRNRSPIIFGEYASPGHKAEFETPKGLDKRVKKKLAGDIEIEGKTASRYLYVFGHKRSAGCFQGR